MTPLRKRMLEDLQVRNLSPSTQTNYINYVAKFALYFGKSPDLLGSKEIRTFLLYLTNQGLSYSTINVVAHALRFFYRVTLGQDISDIQIPLAKTERRLPVLLSYEELADFF